MWVVGSWFMVYGSWFLVPGSWFLVYGSWGGVVPSSEFRVPKVVSKYYKKRFILISGDSSSLQETTGEQGTHI